MAWVERRGRSWRVRYWADTGKAATAASFPTETEAHTYLANLQYQDPTPTPSAPDQQTSALPPAPQPAVPTPQPPTTTPPPPSKTTSPKETTFAQWVEKWWESIEVGPNTAAGYRSLLKNHLLPVWGPTPLSEITPTGINTWLKQLKDRYQASTVSAIGKLLSLILSAAVFERLIPTNPVRIPRQRGRTRREETAWADEHEVLAIARRVAHLANANHGLLVITAAYTGMRWGELTGLRRPALDLTAATLHIHPDHGALHEINGHHTYGPPKTAASVRTVTLPPFLTDLLKQDLAVHRRDHVFTTLQGKLLRRSTFQRRTWAPAVNGCTLSDGTVWKPIKPGLTFHGLRHSHKTWLIEDNIPDVAQARRLGHTMTDEIDDIYSHVADKINTRLLKALEARWKRSIEKSAAAY
ncbi:tyrosine-type recombinase/integrase [Streptomyces yerevanensis]|uniref:tyrosine-type recombinase/integrase n=1 Tax=Streptomyces yerevanensis TaxID=66378 RepID=UPI000526AEA7|nr:site-specific integrase [Streptomyces yerevanensis]